MSEKQDTLNDQLVERFQTLLRVSDDPQMLSDAKEAVNAVFRDKSVRSQAILLATAEKKIGAMSKLVDLAVKVSDSIMDDPEIDENLLDYDLMERSKLLSDVVRNISLLTASTEITKELAATLNDLERSMSTSTIKQMDPEIRSHIQWIAAYIEDTVKKRGLAKPNLEKSHRTIEILGNSNASSD